MQTREKLNKQGKMVWLNGVDNADPFLLPYDSDCAADYGQCGWWKNPSPGAGCAAFFRSRCANETYGSVDLGVLRAGSWGLSIATLLLLRQERGWLVSDWWQGTSSTVPLAWSDDLDRDVGVPSQRHCVEDPGQPGVFERRWSGGVVSVNCSDLSVHLPGKTPVKTDDEPPPHPPALLSKDPACAEQCGECGCTPEKGDRSGNDIWSGVLADEAACCTHCRTLPTAVVYTWDTSGGKSCWCKHTKGPITNPTAPRSIGEFAPPCSRWGSSLLLFVAVASVLYLGGFGAYNYQVQGARTATELAPHKDFWLQLGALVADGCAFAQLRVQGGTRGGQTAEGHEPLKEAAAAKADAPTEPPSPGQAAESASGSDVEDELVE